MVTIENVTVEVDDVDAGEAFYGALGLATLVRPAPTTASLEGFRGFVLGLVAAQPADVDLLLAEAVAAGGTPLKEPARSLWGYGGSLRAPDGTVVSLASSSRKSSGPARGVVEQLVLQLGVADVAASKEFYVSHGFEVAKSFGRRYVELDTGAVSLTLNPREKLARTMGVEEHGSRAHGIVVRGGTGELTDPDGFRWVPA